MEMLAFKCFIYSIQFFFGYLENFVIVEIRKKKNMIWIKRVNVIQKDVFKLKIYTSEGFELQHSA